MSDDRYLWDKSGKPDPEVERLEGVLSELRYRPKARALPPPVRRRPPAYVFALAASFLLAVLGSWVWLRGRPPRTMASTTPSTTESSPPAVSFEVARVEGTPRIGDQALAGVGRLGLGAWLETDANARARITIAAIGHLDVEPSSRIRLVETGPRLHKLELDRGTVKASVVAPPRLFVIGTPSATAVDLGCAYTLAVDAETGDGSLRVTSGWVSLETPARASRVPKGATCFTRKGAGPGTPFFDDAPPALVEALRQYDFEGQKSLATVLAAARVRDALTLFHLLLRVGDADRPAVYRRLAALVTPPPDLDETKLLAGDPAALDRWRKELESHW